MSVKSITFFIALLTALAQAAVILGIIYFLVSGRKRNYLSEFISRNIIILGFAVSVFATLGSLFFSEIAGFAPCRLCWFQRVFMYPQTVLFGLAWLKKDNKAIDYALVFSVIGAAISLYHNYIYYAARKSVICGPSASCAAPYALEFGYISIPLMSLTAFFSIIFLMGLTKIYAGKK